MDVLCEGPACETLVRLINSRLHRWFGWRSSTLAALSIFWTSEGSLLAAGAAEKFEGDPSGPAFFQVAFAAAVVGFALASIAAFGWKRQARKAHALLREAAQRNKETREKHVQLADERKGMEEELRATLERLKLLSCAVEQSPASILITDRDGRIEYVNPKFTEITGYQPEEVLGRNPRVLNSGLTPRETFSSLWSTLLSGRDWRGEFSNRRKNGEIYRECAVISPVKNDRGEITHFVAIKEDVTARREAEEKLRESEERFRQIAETIRDVFWMKSADGEEVLYLSPAFEEIWGIPRERAYQQPRAWLEAVHPDDRPRVSMAVAAKKAGAVFDEEYRIIRPDGTMRWIHSRGFPVRSQEGAITRFAGVAEDISDRKAVELELACREERFRVLIENASDVITIIEPSGTIRFQSPSIERVLGFKPEEMVGRNGLDFIHPEDRQHAIALLKAARCGGETLPPEYRIRHKNGSWRVVESHGKVLPGEQALVLTSRDVTETRQLWEQYRQARKMEAIGNLAGGVAHDFNNLLTVILMHVDLLNSSAPLEVEQAESVRQIHQAAERAANLTRQLLLFSRKQALQPRHMNLAESAGNVIRMLQRILGEDIRIELHCPSSAVPVHADPGMMDQVMMNLAVNARDAMPNGGKLTIEVEAVEISEEYVKRHSEARSGAFARLSILDTGSGIPAHVLPHIFEPFFTTKPAGKGTGLGLATVFGIVQQHQGWIEVESEPEKGAAFHVYLPRASEPQESAAAPELSNALRGSETILVVEDEGAVRQVAVQALAKLGYTVLEAVSGLEALDLWRLHSHRVDLLITDLVMPDGINGRVLAENLLRTRPDLEVIYTSGYTADVAGPEISLEEGVNFLRKPFEVRRLAQIVRERLDEKRGRGR